jgi:hypothetical protein
MDKEWALCGPREDILSQTPNLRGRVRENIVEFNGTVRISSRVKGQFKGRWSSRAEKALPFGVPETRQLSRLVGPGWRVGPVGPRGIRGTTRTKELRGLYSARELYRLIDSHLSVKFSANFCGYRSVAWSERLTPPPTVVNLSFLDRSRYFFFQVASHFSSRGWVDPVPDPLLEEPPLISKSCWRWSKWTPSADEGTVSSECNLLRLVM